MGDVEGGFTETSHENYCQRLGGALCGVVFGLALFLAAGPALWWNEGRAVFTARTLEEGMANVVEAPCAAPNSSLDGRLVHVSCPLENLANFSYVGGAVRADLAVFARAEVQLWQWEERSHSEKESTVGGGTTTKTTYTYARDWKSTPVDSGAFKRPQGHANPPATAWPLRSDTRWATAARVGAYALGGRLLHQVTSASAVPLPSPWPDSGPFRPAFPQPPKELTPATVRPSGDGWLYSYDVQQGDPPVGAVRARFQRSSAVEASVLGRQVGAAFEPWSAPGVREGYDILDLAEGRASAQAMFAQLVAENEATTWALRLVFFLVAWGGLVALTGPASVAPDVVPFLGPIVGDLVGCLLGTAMFFVALAYTMAVVAVAWLRFRPLVGAAALAVAVAGALAYAKLRQRRRDGPKEGELM